MSAAFSYEGVYLTYEADRQESAGEPQAEIQAGLVAGSHHLQPN